MKKILVIGGAGYIGVPLIKLLLKNKFKVTSIDNNLYQNQASINSLKRNRNFNFFNTDFLDKKLLIKLFQEGYKDIIFLAALVGDPISKKYPSLTNEIMKKKTIKLIKFCKNENICNFFYASTCSNYGLDRSNKFLNENTELKPLSLYAKNKVYIEKYLLNMKKFNFTILRFSTAFGMSDRMRFDLTINEFVKIVFFNKTLLVYDADTYRPYLHTKDFARLFLLLLKTKKNIRRKIYNVGGNKNNFSKRSIVKKIGSYLNIKKIKFKDKGNDPRNYKVNFNKIKKELNFEPKYSIGYGIKEIITFLKKTKLSYNKLSKLGNYYIKDGS